MVCGGAHLALVEDSAVAVEQLKGRDNVALNQDADDDGNSGPPASAHRQFIEPLLQRELAHHTVATSEHGRHGGRWDRWVAAGGADAAVADGRTGAEKLAVDIGGASEGGEGSPEGELVEARQMDKGRASESGGGAKGQRGLLRGGGMGTGTGSLGPGTPVLGDSGLAEGFLDVRPLSIRSVVRKYKFL